MRSNRWTCAVVIGSMAGALAGCGEDSVGSNDIKTHGMYADFTATATAESMKVDAVLYVGDEDGDFVKLESGDALIAKVDDEPAITLRPDSEEKHYAKTFDETAGGTKVTIKFDREDDTDAPDSHVTLPEPFDLSLDVSGKVPRDQSVRVIVDPPATSGDRLFWWLESSCLWNRESQRADDDGSFTLESGSDLELFDADKDESCKVTLRVERHNRGTIDEAFGKGGRFLGIQTRSVTFTSTPVAEEEPEGTGGDSGDETGGSANSAGAPGSGGETASGGSSSGGSSEAAAGNAGAAPEETAGGAAGASGAAGETATAGKAGASAGGAAGNAGAGGSAGNS